MSEHYKKLSPTIYEDIESDIKYKDEKKRKARKSRSVGQTLDEFQMWERQQESQVWEQYQQGR